MKKATVEELRNEMRLLAEQVKALVSNVRDLYGLISNAHGTATAYFQYAETLQKCVDDLNKRVKGLEQPPFEPYVRVPRTDAYDKEDLLDSAAWEPKFKKGDRVKHANGWVGTVSDEAGGPNLSAYVQKDNGQYAIVWEAGLDYYEPEAEFTHALENFACNADLVCLHHEAVAEAVRKAKA